MLTTSLLYLKLYTKSCCVFIDVAINKAEEPPTNNELLIHRQWKTQQFHRSFHGTIEALKVTTEHSLLIRMRNIAYGRFNIF